MRHLVVFLMFGGYFLSSNPLPLLHQPKTRTHLYGCIFHLQLISSRLTRQEGVLPSCRITSLSTQWEGDFPHHHILLNGTRGRLPLLSHHLILLKMMRGGLLSSYHILINMTRGESPSSSLLCQHNERTFPSHFTTSLLMWQGGIPTLISPYIVSFFMYVYK